MKFALNYDTIGSYVIRLMGKRIEKHEGNDFHK